MAAFTTIAAGIGLATTAASTAASFVQAGKQRERQKQAEIDAQEAMDAAKAKLEVNYMEGRSIQKEAYERAREAGLAGASQVVQAAREGDPRGAVVGAGRAAVLNEAAQAQARTAMAQDLQNLETAALKEESRLRDARANLDLAEVTGQQQIAADARAAEQAANMAAVGGLVNLGTQAMKLPSLYGSNTANPNESNLLGFNVGTTFDPTNETLNRSQRVFNPSNLSRGLGAVIPTAAEPAAGYEINIPGVTSIINPPIFE